VLFTLPNGTLSSVRLEELDLPASAAASGGADTAAGEPASTPEPGAEIEPGRATAPGDSMAGPPSSSAGIPEPSPPGSETRVVEQAGAGQPMAGPPIPFAPRPDVASPADRAPEGGPSAVERLSRVDGGLVVTRWRHAVDKSRKAVVIHGVLENRSPRVTTHVTLTVRLRDRSGAVLGTADAVLGAERLAPGMAAGFRATVRGGLDFGSVEFEVSREELEFTPLRLD
jgi:hypothetical protein